jgi:hypothetical protein
MISEVITNFDSFVWIASGLFIAGLFVIMAYVRSSSKTKQHPRQKQGTSSNIE